MSEEWKVGDTLYGAYLWDGKVIVQETEIVRVSPKQIKLSTRIWATQFATLGSPESMRECLSLTHKGALQLLVAALEKGVQEKEIELRRATEQLHVATSALADYKEEFEWKP